VRLNFTIAYRLPVFGFMGQLLAVAAPPLLPVFNRFFDLRVRRGAAEAAFDMLRRIQGVFLTIARFAHGGVRCAFFEQGQVRGGKGVPSIPILN
jgi:hypothetical protein